MTCKGNTSLYPIKRAQILAQYSSETADGEQKYQALQDEISRLKAELLLASTDRTIYKNQLELHEVKSLI